jgi:Ca2+-binding RTX toxin-like protein
MAFRFGTTGVDNLIGTNDADVFFMTADNFVTDHLDGGKGNDIVSYGGSSVGVNIDLADGSVTATFDSAIYNPGTHAYMPIHFHQLVAEIANIENASGSQYDDTLTGNGGGNVLNGVGGNDSIDGGGGNDTIVGGAGRDEMTGGTGDDLFVFNHASDTPTMASTYYDLDHITDFVRGEDKIDLHNLVNETTNHHELTFIGTQGFSGEAGEVQSYFTGSLGHMVAIDLDGDKHADMQFLVGSTTLDEMHAHLQASDFIFA